MLDGFFRSAKFLLEEISKPLRYNSRDFSAREPDLITGSRCGTACALKVRAAQDPTVPIRGQVAVPRVSAASSPPRGPQTAHLAHCCPSSLGSPISSHRRHLSLAAGTILHAPHLPFAIPVGTGSVGWIADLRRPRAERLGRAGSGVPMVDTRCRNLTGVVPQLRRLRD